MNGLYYRHLWYVYGALNTELINDKEWLLLLLLSV